MHFATLSMACRLAACSLLGQAATATAVPVGAAGVEARTQCEDALEQALHAASAARAADIRFDPATGADEQDGHLTLKGTGHYRREGRGPMSIRYACAYDETAGRPSGVLYRETGVQGGSALPVWRADLSRLDIDGCQSAAAAALQAGRPRTGTVGFDEQARSLQPGADGGTLLVGGGRFVAAQGLAALPFRYRCEFDASGGLRRAETK